VRRLKVVRLGPLSVSTYERDEYAMDLELPVTQCRTELGRMTAQGRRTDDGSMCTLLVINEADGSWSFHGLTRGEAVTGGRNHIGAGHLEGDHVSGAGTDL
jgi:hypothetical protein